MKRTDLVVGKAYGWSRSVNWNIDGVRKAIVVDTEKWVEGSGYSLASRTFTAYEYQGKTHQVKGSKKDYGKGVLVYVPSFDEPDQLIVVNLSALWGPHEECVEVINRTRAEKAQKEAQERANQTRDEQRGVVIREELAGMGQEVSDSYSTRHGSINLPLATVEYLLRKWTP